jgi:hypothetical protein
MSRNKAGQDHTGHRAPSVATLPPSGYGEGVREGRCGFNGKRVGRLSLTEHLVYTGYLR